MDQTKFKTKDKALAAYLMLCTDVKFLEYFDENGMMFFIFTPSNACAKHREEFDNPELILVHPLAYFKKLSKINKWISNIRHSNERDSAYNFYR